MNVSICTTVLVSFFENVKKKLTKTNMTTLIKYSEYLVKTILNLEIIEKARKI